MTTQEMIDDYKREIREYAELLPTLETEEEKMEADYLYNEGVRVAHIREELALQFKKDFSKDIKTED
jgi:hypothetical protein